MSRRHLSQTCPCNNSNAAFDDSWALTLIKCVLLFKMMLCVCGWWWWWWWGSTVQLKNHSRDHKLPGVCAGEVLHKCCFVGSAKQNSCIYLRVKQSKWDRWQTAADLLWGSLQHVACVSEAVPDWKKTAVWSVNVPSCQPGEYSFSWKYDFNNHSHKAMLQKVKM